MGQALWHNKLMPAAHSSQQIFDWHGGSSGLLPRVWEALTSRREAGSPVEREVPASPAAVVIGAHMPSRAQSNPPEQEKNGSSKLSEIRCHVCGAVHHVPHDVQATTCPACGRSILLTDVVIAESVSRLVDTRGHLIVEKNGSLYSPLSVCGRGSLYGIMAGALHCEGCLEIHSRGNLPVRIFADELIIHKEAQVFCPYPLHVRRAIIRGTLHAPVFARGPVEVMRRGCLEGVLSATALKVQRGARQVGQTVIGPQVAQATVAQPPPMDDFRQLCPRHAPRRLRRLPSYAPVLGTPGIHEFARTPGHSETFKTNGQPSSGLA